MLYEFAFGTVFHARWMIVGATRLTARLPGGATKHAVSKDHGFGTGPATRSFPSALLPAIVTVYSVHAWRAGLGVRVRTVFPAVHPDATVAPGTKFQVTVTVSIPRLNVTTMGAVALTPVAPFAGVVEEICGGGQRAWKDHGFGTGPAPRLTPFVSCPLIVTA